tara:strand:+ start:351 stop:551 length:201 start_codon:yes stop_codon:yes gene_type:complete
MQYRNLNKYTAVQDVATRINPKTGRRVNIYRGREKCGTATALFYYYRGREIMIPADAVETWDKVSK